MPTRIPRFPGLPRWRPDILIARFCIAVPILAEEIVATAFCDGVIGYRDSFLP
jgi:hypothetical protein